MNPILEQFLSEARENLLFLDKNLENLEGGDKESVNALFRAAHTLKGSSGLAGFDAVKEITHIAEDLLDAYRNDKIFFSQELLETLYDMFDEVTELVDGTEESGEVLEVSPDRIDEFKKLRSQILDEKEEVLAGLDTELNIVDDEIPYFANFIKNDFNGVDILSLGFEPAKVTKESFEQMGYYFVDIDLSEDTLEMGNDPFYSTYLLENENIISIYTKISSSCEKIKENPLEWATRIVLLVRSDKQLLEDAFYNFLDEVTIYPVCIKSLFNADLEPQSNESIQDFLNDLQLLSQNNDFSNLRSILAAVKDIVNPGSLQGFLFLRLEYILENFDLSPALITQVLNYIFKLIGLEEKIILNEPQTDDLVQISESLETEQQIPDFNIEVEQSRLETLKDILLQQKEILNDVDNENVITQVKELLSKLEFNLKQDFMLDECNDKQSLLNLVESLLKSICRSYGKCEEDHDEKQEEEKANLEIPKTEQKEIKEKKTQKTISKTVKIDLAEIDNMMDVVGEMLVIKNSLPYIAQDLNIDNIELSKRDLLARYDEINRVTTQLQEKVMQMRLLSLSFIFDRYPKLVRDISKSLGKKIKYHEDGGDTKLDKTIIEKLADPLIHIIRNSLDHGIETPEQRVAKGKDPEGNITIKAESLGDKVYVTIEDDGKGIDVDKVVHKSLEKNMVNPDELDSMSQEEKLMLVFHPGVSTMEKISELSGRGVGMDVVKKTIDEIGGKISLKSEVDRGTKLTLELPMSVALSNVFHVKLGDANYALSMDCINETVRVTKKEVEYINRKPMLKLRGDLIPLVFNYDLLSKDIDNNDTYSLLLVETQGTKFGFVVDEFVNQLDIVQKPLASNFKNHPFISGTSLLGNGEVLFVINPAKLINLKEKK